MAREKVFKVIIDGEEYVSKAAGDAEKGVDKFVAKKDGWFKSFMDLKAAWDVVAGAARALYGVARESIDAFDEYKGSLQKLEGTAKITGIPLAELQGIAADAKKEFGLSTPIANDLATAVANLSLRAGGMVDKGQLLASVLDLGAARGINAKESLESFERAIMGIDAGFDKLYGKNQSVIFEEYAASIGTSVGKLTDMQKGLALVWFTLEAGEKTSGQYKEWLESSAGQQFMLNKRLDDAKIAFGALLSPVRDVIVRGFNEFITALDFGKDSTRQLTEALVLIAKNGVGVLLTAWQTFGPAVIAILKATVAGVMLFGDAVRTLSIGVQKGVGEIVDRIGWLVQKGGSVLKAFGIDIVADWGDTMREWGRKTSDQADESWSKFRRDSTAAWASIRSDATSGAAAATAPIQQIGAVAEQQLGTNVPAASAKAGRAVREHLGPALADTVTLTTDALDTMRITANRTLEPAKAQAFESELQKLVARSHEVRDRINGWSPAVEDSEKKAKDLSREVGTLARAGLDVGQAFGVIDQQAAAILNSVTNIATALPKALAGDLTSMAGIIGGVANIASQIIGGDSARRELLRNNTRGLERLADEVSGLSLNVTGEKFASVQGVLASVVPQLKGGIGNFGQDMARLFSGLRDAGLSMADLEKVASALGINLKDSKGNFSIDAVRQLLTAMGMVTPTTGAKSFRDQLDAMMDGFKVQGTSGIAQLSSLFGLGSQFRVGLLDGIFNPGDLQATRTGLADLFGRFQRGELSASDLGGLTSAQFRAFMLDLIARTDDLLKDGGAAPAPSAPSAPLDPDETFVPGVGPVPTAQVAALADVFASYAADTLPLFEQQVQLQTRVAEATEATAANTAMTVDELRALRDAIVGGALVENIDRALADRRREAELVIGQGITL